jgi:hypothetical protein
MCALLFSLPTYYGSIKAENFVFSRQLHFKGNSVEEKEDLQMN